MTDYQTITAILANIIYVLVIYKLLHVFLTSQRSTRQEFYLYGAAYGVLTVVYLVWNIPLLTLASNIIVMLALSCAYPASWRRRLLAVAFTASMIFLCETMVIEAIELRGMTHYTDYTNQEYFIAQVTCNLVTYLAAIWLSKLGQLKTEAKLPNNYWVAILAVPALTIIPTYVLLMTVSDKWNLGLFISVVLLFILNGLVLYLYGQIIVLYQEKLAQQAIREQNRIFMRQLEVEQEALAKMRQLRHDWNNRLLPILGQMEHKDYLEAETALRRLVAEQGRAGRLVQQGDPVIAAVINYKLAGAQSAGIEVRCTVDIPTDLSKRIDVQEIGVLLGNLLDNAMRAVTEDEQSAHKFIELKLSILLGTLVIVVSNSFAGRLNMAHGEYQTTKNDADTHGLGLKAVQQIVAHYQGDMAIETDDQVFKVRIKLFLPEAKI